MSGQYRVLFRAAIGMYAARGGLVQPRAQRAAIVRI